jgi:hypothetical protein
MRLSAIRRLLYRGGSVLGDVEAVERSIETGSPAPLARRYVRKLAYRGLSKALRKGGL